MGARAPPPSASITADKQCLERQWDSFVSITALEIVATGTAEFEVADVFVRNAKSEGARWWRVGKVAAAADADVGAALAIQKGLILWTAIHLRDELMAVGGRTGAAALECGFARASLYMATADDGPVGDDGDDGITIATAVKCKGISSRSIGFRPDWNPTGFTYKRRESDSMAKKGRSRLDLLV